jgi:beta-glucanase (GH16 family)
MLRPVTALASLALPLLASAWSPPSYAGWSLVWADDFSGSGGSSPNTNNWNIITGYLNVNAELEVYSSSTANVQLSGGSTLQIVPWRDSSALNGWTSGRIESKYTVTPQSGVKTIAEALIRFGTNDISTKQGIWPAFWMLGNSLRTGGEWPECGELDILETVNGQLTGYGTAHCDVYPGGICNEPNGLQGHTGIPDQSWHTWRIVWDRTTGNWQTETVTWYMDGAQFQQISGGSIGDYNVWTTLCYDPMYFLLNVAVGGQWVSTCELCFVFELLGRDELTLVI